MTPVLIRSVLVSCMQSYLAPQLCSRSLKEKAPQWLGVNDLGNLSRTVYQTTVAVPVFSFDLQEQFLVIFFSHWAIQVSRGLAYRQSRWQRCRTPPPPFFANGIGSQLYKGICHGVVFRLSELSRQAGQPPRSCQVCHHL